MSTYNGTITIGSGTGNSYGYESSGVVGPFGSISVDPGAPTVNDFWWTSTAATIKTTTITTDATTPQLVTIGGDKFFIPYRPTTSSSVAYTNGPYLTNGPYGTSGTVGFSIADATAQSISVVGTSSSTSSTITAPSGISAGDLIVLIDMAVKSPGIPTTVTPTGFVLAASNLTAPVRANISIRVADGTESGTSITGMNGTGANNKAMIVLRSAAGAGWSIFVAKASTSNSALSLSTPIKNYPEAIPTMEIAYGGSNGSTTVSGTIVSSGTSFVSTSTFRAAYYNVADARNTTPTLNTTDGGANAGAILYISAGTANASTTDAVGAASGVGTATAVGRALISAVGAAAGAGAASGTGRSAVSSVGSASGVAAASATGRATVNSVGSAAGVLSVSGVGGSVVSAVGAASGVLVATGISVVGTAVGQSSAALAAVAVGTSLVQAVGTASGAASGDAIGTAGVAAVGASSGVGNAVGIGQSQVNVVGIASGALSANASGGQVISAVGVSASVLTAIAYYEAPFFAPYPTDSVVVFQGTLLNPVARAVALAQFWSTVTTPVQERYPITPIPLPRVVSLSDNDWIWIYAGEDKLPLRASLGQLRAFYNNDPPPPPPAIVGFIHEILGDEIVKYVQGTDGSLVETDLDDFLKK